MGSVRTGGRKEALAKTTRRLQIALGEWQQQSSKRCRSAEVQQCSSAEAGAETHTQAGPPRRAFPLRFTSGGGRSRTSAGAGAGQAREMQGEEKVDTHQPSQSANRPREKRRREKKRFEQRAWRKSRGGPKIWDSQRRASDKRAAGPGPPSRPNLHLLCTALPNLHGGGTRRAGQKKKDVSSSGSAGRPTKLRVDQASAPPLRPWRCFGGKSVLSVGHANAAASMLQPASRPLAAHSHTPVG